MAVHANVGDWLIVKSRASGHSERRAVILGVGTDGLAPFTVKWVDDGRQALMFPGPDAHIVTPAQVTARNDAEAKRIAAVQAEITTDQPGGPATG